MGSCSVVVGLVLLTLAGPMIMPVHRVRVMSSSSSRPQLTVPSPSPFCPSSSSSNKRKLRGTLTPETTRAEYELPAEILYLSYYQQIPWKEQSQQWTDCTDKYSLCFQSLIHYWSNVWEQPKVWITIQFWLNYSDFFFRDTADDILYFSPVSKFHGKTKHWLDVYCCCETITTGFYVPSLRTRRHYSYISCQVVFLLWNLGTKKWIQLHCDEQKVFFLLIS